MYREPHLNQKSNECSAIWNEWYPFFKETNNKESQSRARELRKKWCQCCDELGNMISQEYLTNGSYESLRNLANKQ